MLIIKRFNIKNPQVDIQKINEGRTQHHPFLAPRQEEFSIESIIYILSLYSFTTLYTRHLKG